MPKRSSTKSTKFDPNLVAKRILDEATGEAPKTPAEPEPDRTKNPNAVALGRLGGLKGGKARAEKLTPAKRKAIAKKAARSRWNATERGEA